MKLIINKNQLNIPPERFLKNAGYNYLRDKKTGQDSFTRRLGRNFYPRFHIYPSHMGENVILNIHLDQKRPRYEGVKAHNAEYEGEALEREVERIRELLPKQVSLVPEKRPDKEKRGKGWWSIFGSD